MVKSLIAIASAAVLLAGAVFFEWFFVERQFKSFHDELSALYLKAEDETANGEDAKAVQTSWENKKDKLYVWIPHNDISRIDDYMSETVRLIAEKEYPLALAKLEIIMHLTHCLPDTYKPSLENIF